MTKKTRRPRKRAKKTPPPVLFLLAGAFLLGAVYYLWVNYGGGFPEPRAPHPEPPGAEGNPPAPGGSEINRLKVYSFNIQIFGEAKMKKPPVVEVLVDIVTSADAVAIQEVRAKTDQAVRDFMALLPPRYGYLLGPREGRSVSKEQFWVIYDTEKLALTESAPFDDAQDRFQRSPLGVYFQSKTGNFDFILIDNHIEPAGASAEIAALPEVIAYFQNLWNEPDVLVVGDFNADGRYYNEARLGEVFPDSGYKIIIGNEYDTTVAASDNTYDRFIITKSAEEDFTGEYGVLYFDNRYDFGALGIEPKQVSDHYPVWAEFYLDRDSN